MVKLLVRNNLTNFFLGDLNMDIKDLFEKIGKFCRIYSITYGEWLLEPNYNMRNVTFEYVKDTLGIRFFILERDSFEIPKKIVVKVVE